MASVGVRELKQNASAVLRRVKAGESIEVTQRGQPVARIVPIRPMNILDQMVAEGRATRAEFDLVEWLKDNPPLPVPPGMPTLSEGLAEMRADER
ncbi:MAG TPA: type II toxin-antitoxin system prevent-host-death family antitoxin [Chloroflexota bacterium]|jgi:prevent-host-death family protein